MQWCAPELSSSLWLVCKVSYLTVLASSFKTAIQLDRKLAPCSELLMSWRFFSSYLELATFIQIVEDYSSTLFILLQLRSDFDALVSLAINDFLAYWSQIDLFVVVFSTIFLIWCHRFCKIWLSLPMNSAVAHGCNSRFLISGDIWKTWEFVDSPFLRHSVILFWLALQRNTFLADYFIIGMVLPTFGCVT